jgi:hypothetical protein
MRELAWAASVVLAVGLGYGASRLAERHPQATPGDEVALPATAPEAPAPERRAPAAAPAPAPMSAPVPLRERTAPPPARKERADAAAGYLAATERAVSRPIDLDEAARRLGGPIRLLDGLTPLSIAVAPGVAVPGADPTREVVRVVYRDAHGTEMILEQQRVDTMVGDTRRAAANAAPAGPAGPAGPGLSWTDGAFRLRLSAPVATDSLERLRARVR